MVEAMKFMVDSGIDLSRDVSLLTHFRHGEYLMVVFMRQGASTKELIIFNQCRTFLRVTMIADMASVDGKQLM
jgi:hypothetical protein